MATIREVFGAGSFCGYEIPVLSNYTIPILIQAPGGFMVFGLLIAIVNAVTKGKALKKKDFGCKGCPAYSSCSHNCDAVKEAK